MDPKKRLQVLQQQSPSIRTAVAPKPQAITVNTGKRNVQVEQDPNLRIEKGYDPKLTKVQAISSGTARGISAAFKDATDLLPQGIGQLKAITPHQFDKQADKARSFAQKVSDEASLFNTTSRLLQDNGYGIRENGDLKDEGAQKIATGVRIGSNVAMAAGAAAEAAPTIVKGVKNVPKLIENGKNIVNGLKVGGLTGAKEAASINKSTKVANQLGVNAELLHSLKTDNDVSSVLGKLIDSGMDAGDDLVGIAEAIAKSKSAKEVGRALADLPIQAGGSVITAAAASDGVARAKYGISPLTGEVAKAEKIVDEAGGAAGGAAAPGNAVDPNNIPFSQPGGIELQGKKYEEIAKSAEDLAGVTDETPVGASTPEPTSTPQTNDLSQAIKANAPEVANNPAVAQGVQQAFLDTGIKDPYNLLVNAISSNSKKSEIREIVKSLVGNGGAEDTNLVNRLTKKLTDAKTPDEVHSAIDAETAAAKAPDVPGTGVAVTDEAQVAKGTEQSQSGVADDVQSSPDAQTTAPSKANDETLDDTINRVASDAATDGDKAITELQDSLKKSANSYKDLEKIRKQERAARAAKADAAYDAAGGGEKGMAAKMSALKGEYAKGDYIGADVSAKTKKMFLDDVQEMVGKGDLQSFQGTNVQTALRKIWGDIDKTPTKADVKYVQNYLNKKQPGLGDDIAQDVSEAMEAMPKDWRYYVQQIAGIPRTAMASFDLSMGGRQGLPVAARSSKEWGNANLESLKYVKSKKYFEKEMKAMGEDPDIDTIVDAMGVRLPAVFGVADEQMNSAAILEKLPVYGKGIEMSDRAYSGGLSKLRYNIAKTWLSALKQDGRIDELTDDQLRDIGEVINTFTGSGGKKGGLTEKNMTSLSATLFAPRLLAANVNRLNPAFYKRLDPGKAANAFEKVFGAPNSARRRAVEYQSSFATLAGSVIGLVGATGLGVGATINADPRSSDFMKIKVGNTRYDILGGQGQPVVLLAREITGQKVDSTTGEEATLGSDFGAKNRFDLGLDFIFSKANPVIGATKRILEMKPDDEGKQGLFNGQDKYGEDTSIAKTAGDLITPLNVGAVRDTAKDTGSIKKGIAMNVPSFFGFGAQTYGATKTKDQGKTNAEGQKEFKGEITQDMITDNNGKAVLDDKGRVVKVKIPEGASKAEITALKDQKRESALKDQYKRTLSTEDQALLGRSDKELKEYVKKGVINQAKYDKLQTQRGKLDSIGKADDGSNAPEGVDTDYGKNFYKKYQTLSKEQKDDFVKNNNTTDESKAVVTAMNNNVTKPASVPKLEKMNNQLAKTYVDYEADMKKNADKYTVIDKQNKAKEFWNKAIKTQYDSVAQDLVSEGNSKDYKALVAEGKITKKQLDQAIQLDNALYQTGWNSLKFNKKFRDGLGYATPSKTADGKAIGGSGSGSGASEINAHLSSLLPDSGKASGGVDKVPTISSKSRAIKFKGTGGTSYKPSTPKRISINL